MLFSIGEVQIPADRKRQYGHEVIAQVHQKRYENAINSGDCKICKGSELLLLAWPQNTAVQARPARDPSPGLIWTSDAEKLAKISFVWLTTQESGEGITAKVNFNIYSKIESSLSDSTDQQTLKIRTFCESKAEMV